MPRPKLYPEQLRLPLAEGTIGRIDDVLAPGEARLDMLRAAIEAEIARRIEARPPSEPEPKRPASGAISLESLREFSNSGRKVERLTTDSTDDVGELKAP